MEKDPCSEINNFYKCFTDIKFGMLANNTIGPFGGVTNTYTFQSKTGLVKVQCDSGINTLTFSNIKILLLGSVKSSGESISSEGTGFNARKISRIENNGTASIKTLFFNGNITFPIPISN